MFVIFQVNVFYNGCVILEVRDYRRSTIGSFESQYVLLKPNAQVRVVKMVFVPGYGLVLPYCIEAVHATEDRYVFNSIE